MGIDICTDRDVTPSVAVTSPDRPDRPDRPDMADLADLAGVPGVPGVPGVLAKGTSRGTLRIKPPKGRTDVVFRTVTLAPGDSTGWHHHPGQIIAVVLAGTLTRVLHDCSVETVRAGEAFVEPAGRRNRHIGHNLGAEPVVLYMTCLLPEDEPLSIEAEAPDCAFRLP